MSSTSPDALLLVHPHPARHVRRLLCASLATVLTTSLLTVTPADAERPKPQHLKGQVEKLDNHGGEVRGIGWTPKQQPQVDLPDPVWPVAGSAVVTLPAADQPAAARKRAGTLPVSVGRGPGTAGNRLSAVNVDVLDRAKIPARWRDGVVARLSTPSGNPTGSAAVAVDYSGFRYAYGAQWASRLRLWQLPGCALMTPDKAGCSATPLPSRNDSKTSTVTADVVVAESAATSSGSLVVLSAGPSGDSGDYTASSLAASSTWTVGGSAGDFSWSYPMRVPPATGGLDPKLALSYSSASVDGRSAATNNQPSWIGEGFDFWPGYIERRYLPCAEDKTGSPNNPTQTGDLCWRSDNAVMSLNGSSTELVYESGKGWHGRSEDGSKIEKLSGATNGDDNGEHWKVTTTDGTQYFFGLNKLPGQTADTDSAWTVPVYGNHAGEPCHATAFADSDCAQAWRWNLDYVVDVRGNTLSYWYDKELNQYAAEVTDSKNISYVRGGTLTRIDYGTWDRGSTARSVNPASQVLFTTSDRCVSSCAIHDGEHWPDVPWDQECKPDATSCTDYSPTFWSTKRLTKITTRVWDTTKTTPAWQDVDSWTFEHTFPSPGDGTNGGLWLASIVHAGHVGGTLALPPVTFEPVSMPNRVLTKTNTTNNWQRLSSIITETGARIQVTYSLRECSSSNLPSAPHTNTKLCYPVIGPDPYNPGGPDITEWWHKYVVVKVSETDVQLADGHEAPPKNSYYTYEGAPAWHYADDDGLTKANRKTWNQFRGYATVAVQVGDTNQTLTRTTYLRGMHGDKASPTGGTRTVTVPASIGPETVYDEDQFAGMAREQVTYNGTDDKPITKTVNVPWRSAATASRTINGDTVTARFVQTRVNYHGTALGVNGDRGWRITSSWTDFDDTYGTAVRSQDNGDTAKTGDEKCVTYTYNRNTAKNIVTLPRQLTTTALTCGSAPTSPDHVISDTLTYYDEAASAATAPSYGAVTRVDSLKDWTAAGGTAWQTIITATFDGFGRQLTASDIRNNTTTTAYTPTAALVTKTTATNHLGWVTTTETNPYWGSPTKVTDPNGQVTEMTYDALGRTSQVWNVGWSKATYPDKPSERYTYVYSTTRSTYPYVKTEALNAAGNYLTSYLIYDALLRPRQAQTAAVGGGRVVTDTLYDAWGRAEMAYGAHAEPGEPSGTLWWEPEWSVPSQSRTVYDRANRATGQIFLAGDGVTNIVEKWRTTTSYAGDQITVTPPAGGTATTTITDAQGRTTELRQYTTTSGTSGAYDTTRYTYDQKDQLTKVTDPAGNEWTYKYDIKGRQTESRDPDKGLLVSEYNDLNDLIKTTDARGEVLVYTYDSLGRKTGLYDDSASNTTKRAEWIYDRLYTGATVRGQLTQTIRYEGGNAYRWQARGFTKRYQVSGANYVIPTAEIGLAGTYVYGYGYSAYNGQPTSISYPAGGNLGGEGVTTGYDPVSGLPTSLTTNMTNVGAYVDQQQYTAYGEPTVTTLKIASGVYAESAVSYDTATRRIRTVKIKPETSTGTVSDRTYEQDPAGNIISIADTPEVGQSDYQCFTYDPLRRLTSAWTPTTNVDCKTATPAVAELGGPAPYWLDWTIDKIGNRTNETMHTAGGDTVRTYDMPTPGAGVLRPHAVTSTTTTLHGQTTGTTASYTYDDTGNMKTRPGPSAGQTLTWDAEGQLVKVEEASTTTTTTNVYDADGTRLIRRDGNGSTLYLPGMEIRRQVSGTTATLSATRYYVFAGSVVASRSPGAKSLDWLFSDHQGTHQISVNAYTQQVTTRRQTPYGGPRGTQPTWPTPKGFVGGDLDPTGLTHLGAREYDPGLGRFISVDPIQDLADPQQWNGYSYANNSPVTLSDPSGLSPEDAQWEATHPKAPNKAAKSLGWNKYGCPDDDCTPRDENGLAVRLPVYVGKNGTTLTLDLLGYYHLNGYRLPPGDVDVVRLATIMDNNRAAVRLKDENSADPVKRVWATLTEIMWACAEIKGCPMQDNAFIMAIDEARYRAVELSLAGRSNDSMSWQEALIEMGMAGVPLIGTNRVGGVRGSGILRNGCKSFDGDTKVLMADGTTKPISEIKIGDQVLATDPEAGKQGPRTVTHLWVHLDTIVALSLNGETIDTTEDHPYWNATDHGWQRADELDRGDLLLTPTGSGVPVGGLLRDSARITTAYNLTVDDIHTYYVLAGNTPVLVHNAGGDDPSLGDMKKLSDSQAKKVVGDVHEFKQDVVGRGAKISSYDVYIEKSTGNLYLMDKSGRNPIPTYVNKGGTWHPGVGGALGGC